MGCSDSNDGSKESSDRPTSSWRCTVGETQSCYSGPAGTNGVGICKAGHKDCINNGNGSEWTECLDEVVPDYDYPCDANNVELDSDCNGIADTRQDEDGDGLTVCDTYGRRLDCCDNDKQCIVPGMKSSRPALRRLPPDCIGDFLDGDCDGIVDNGDTECTEKEIQAARDLQCGDGHLQNFEECDDGKENNDGSYGKCNSNCTYAHYCGDGVVNTAFGEVCDEGLGRIKSKNDNGEEIVTGGGTGTYNHCKSDCSGMSDSGYCGDGKLNGDEECDDGYLDPALGKRVGGDGKYGHCRPDCRRAPFCGDGVVNTDPSIGDVEVCDDGLGYVVDANGNIVGGGTGAYGNNCLPDCSARTAWCGDGTVDEGYEECDEAYTDAYGNVVGGDGSYNGCNEGCSRADYCGDGKVHPSEECDNGTYGNQGFYGGCKPNCTRSNYCGDGVTTSPYEDCDKGKDSNGNSLNVGGYNLNKTPNICTSDCSFGSYCGDGIVDSQYGEECDEGSFANNGAYGGCTGNCKLAPRCGDGTVDEGYEECDLGTNNRTSGYGTCNSVTCTWNMRCGDGIVNGSEQCDDGLYKGKDPTTGATIYVGGTGEHGGCNENCTLAPRCGDGKLDSRYEECDLGTNNGKSGYGCSSVCTIVPGWECSGTTCSVIPCGNGRLDSGELCDESIASQSTYCKGCYPIAGYVCKGGTPACPSGKCTSTKPCIPIASLYGDGVIAPEFEDCDDGNKTSGDGCSNGSVEKGYICPIVNERCVAAACGDGIRAYGEECDDGNVKDGDGCSSRCKRESGFACKTILNEKSVCYTTGGKGKCGDGYIQYGEQCDDGNTTSGDGCSSTCQIENKYKCAYTNVSDGIRVKGGKCTSASSLCGNGTLNKKDNTYIYAEECDLGSNNGTGKGCDSNRRLSTGYHCNAAGTSCTKGSCQNGILDVGEECDDGNHYPNDGCSPSCKKEYMFESYTHDDGKITYSAKCGDGITLWMLPARDSSGKIKCTNGKTLNAGEKKEVCKSRYGSSVTYVPVEACDDGNMVSGDGCSSQCTIEDGWSCTDWSKAALDKYVDMDINYYDFRAHQSSNSNTTYATKTTTEWKNVSNTDLLKYGGWMTNNWITAIKNRDSTCNKAKLNNSVSGNTRYGFPDMGCNYGGSGCKGMVNTTLDSSGKPVLASSPSSCTESHVTCKGTFYYWYRSTPGLNYQYKSTLRLFQDNSDTDKYVFDSSTPYKNINNTTVYALLANGKSFATIWNGTYDNTAQKHANAQFYPLRGTGYESTENAVGETYKFGNFTSELHTYFQYKGGEKLEFFGDDDVWAFINHRLFVDLGGMQSGNSASNTLKADQCYTDVKCDKDFDIYEDGIYELHFFQAERCDSGSRYKLTLDGFLKTGKSTCTCPSNSTKCSLTCGNGKVERGEECDCDSNGKNCKNASNASVACFPRTCKLSTCGDGVIDTDNGEECDQGSKNGTKNAYCTSRCLIQVCGDGEQGAGEECDLGSRNEANPYGPNKCTTSCKIAPYCGDGHTDSGKGEVCDNGRSNNDDAYGDNSCTSTCKRAHYCGDGYKDSREQCDKGTANNNGLYGGCNKDCTLAPRCGDRIINGSEECDNGPSNSVNAYGQTACLDTCQRAPYCGDNRVNGAQGREQCDQGSANSATAYGPDKCNNKCLVAAYCGDGIKNGTEECDYGSANKDGEYGGCSTSCKLNARCGDGNVDPGYETCDDGINNGAYNGCTSSCTKAGYCGDGIKNGPEQCDYGQNNEDGLYGGCSTKCKFNSYCGDGVINSDENEACDKGTANNKGEYNGCNSNCTKAPYCGDGVVNGTSTHPEECDFGTANNIGAYGGCTRDCKRASACGDGITDANSGEECDDGIINNKGEYNGCDSNCRKGPYCGDGIVNGTAEHPEECDLGAELNDGQYGGCNSDCTLAPYCGDGNVDTGEECDFNAPDAYMCSPYCKTIST